MKKALRVVALYLGLLVAPLQVAADTDTYLGDTGIYAAVDTGVSERPRPNVLFIIDTSRATLNPASGTQYWDKGDDGTDPLPTYTGTYNPWDIYVGDNKGIFSRLEVANSTIDLENLTCRGVVADTLLNFGTYSGSGSETSPNLNGGACATGPKGATYALGNYLNYLNTPAVSGGAVIVQNSFTCTIKYTSGKKTVTTTITDGCIGTYQLTASHTTGATSEPGVGTNWANYWTVLSSGCDTTKSPGCSASSAPVSYTPPAGTTVWTSGVEVTAPPPALTQREIIYNALEEAVGGARSAVNIGAMAYNPNNQGGEPIYDIADLRPVVDSVTGAITSDATFEAFMAAVAGAELIASGPNRPQAEALYDAGHYYGAAYPTSGGVTINDDGTLNITGSTSRESGINSCCKTTDYGDTHRNPCGYNHIILVTNGLSNGDGNPILENVVDSDGDGRADESVYGEGSHYADDVAAYLKKHENITVHTVLAFQAEDALVHRTATVGGGQFFNVYDAAGLAEALNKILAGIVNEIDTSFVAPVVPASSTNRTISSNRVYLGLFKPQNNAPWYGNLKKYGVNADLQLTDKNGDLATTSAGDFLPLSKSWWGATGTGQIMSEDGLLDPLDHGDGGVVPAGGVGGQLKIDLTAAAALGNYEVRNIYTKPPASTSNDLNAAINAFRTSNTTGITTVALGGVTATERTSLIKYLHGYDGYDDDIDGNSNEIRSWFLGDILHAKPLIFNYSSFLASQENDCNYNKTMIYVGANDGMMHAFRDCDGREAWAFIPPNLLPMLKYIRNSDHNYFSDGAATAYVHDVNANNVVEANQGDKVVIIFGQRRGGGRNTLTAADPRGSYFALDVTDPTDPQFMWSIDSSSSPFGDNFSELGETWTQPRLTKVKVLTADKVVAFVGAGYDNNEDLRFGNNMQFPNTTTVTTDTTVPTFDGGTASSTGTASQFNPRGRGIYAIEVATLVKDANNLYQPDFTYSGDQIWAYTPTQNASLTYSIPSDLTVMDADNNGYSDRIYVGDTGGRLWRFNVGNTDVGQWNGNIIFNANSDLATQETTAGEDAASAKGKGRKFFYRPSLALIGGIPTLYIGSGDREHPLNRGVVDRLYAIKDRGQTTAKGSNDLVNLTANELQGANTSSTRISELLGQLQSDENWYGWFIDLEHTGEKNLSSPLVFSGQAFYTTYTPKASDELGECEVGNLGIARLYHLDAVTGEAVYNYAAENDSGGAGDTNERAKGEDGGVLTKGVVSGVMRDDRVLNLGEGIPSGITVQLDASGKASLMISSSNRVGSYTAPDAKLITPLYWLQW